MQSDNLRYLRPIPVVGKGHFRLFVRHLALRLCLGGCGFLGRRVQAERVMEVERWVNEGKKGRLYFFLF
jgi:hypothetical protein